MGGYFLDCGGEESLFYAVSNLYGWITGLVGCLLYILLDSPGYSPVSTISGMSVAMVRLSSPSSTVNCNLRNTAP